MAKVRAVLVETLKWRFSVVYSGAVGNVGRCFDGFGPRNSGSFAAVSMVRACSVIVVTVQTTKVVLGQM